WDIVFGRAGNDSIDGGAGDDILHGDAGDDTIEGGAGRDVLLGGADHDVLYGHSQTGADDDNAVDYVYGDFGTNADEVGSGQDQLFGGGGNDLLFGEAGDDSIDAGSGGSDLVDFGTGDGATPNDFTPPMPTAPLALLPGIPLVLAGPSLPSGPNRRGRWSGLGSDDEELGVSGDPAVSFDPAIATNGDARFVTWSDGRSGNLEIYVARYDAGGWQQLAGSAEQGGVSNTPASSRYPSITVDAAGNPIAAWAEITAAGSDVFAAAWDPAADGGQGDWVALGDSQSAGGISNSGSATRPQIINTAAGPVVVWLDRANGVTNVRARRFDGANWVGLGGSETGSGISAATSDVSQLAVATDGTKIAVAWTQAIGGVDQFYLREFDGSDWQQLAGSASGNGISGTVAASRAPTLAYHNGELFVAWQQADTDLETPGDEIYAARFSGGSWQAAGVGSNTGGGVSNSRGSATQPRLASGGDRLQLFWTDDQIAGR
ncbi:MAG: hypothetical protein KDA55_19315, partial [Planctomycetales bacterium]|nr:hypothetical protein [Planctomycetales bacterium]